MLVVLLSLVASFAAASDSTLEFLDAHGGRWVSDHSCVSCHSAWSYALARAGTPEWQASPLEQTLAYVNERQADWASINPWYGTRGSQKGSESFGSEAILEASLLVEVERTAGLPLSETAIRHMLDLQQPDGSFPWLDYHLEPLESSNAAIWGAAIARIAIARSGFSTDPQALAKLDRFLVESFSKDETSLYCRVAIVWAATESNAILSSSQAKDLFQAVEALQREDGGWSMNDLGPWKKQGSNADSDANATAFVLLALQQSPEARNSDFSPMVTRAQGWLEKNKNPDGSWSGASVNYDSDFNRALMTDFATGLAYRALTPHRYQK